MNLIDFGNRVKQKRLDLQMTQEELAKAAGYTSRSSINKIELGLVDLPQSKIIAIAKALHTAPTYLMGWSQDPTIQQDDIFQYDAIRPITTKKVRMIGKVACGVPIYADEDKESYIQVGTDINADFCVTASGDSMTGARIYDGDIVFCRSQEMVNNGEIAVVVIGDSVTLKRVYLYPEKQKLVLQAENPKYEPFVYVGEELSEIRILGKAVAFQSDVK
jgi:repressor LexA